MAKLKTNKGAAKRFRKSKGGKWMHKPSNKRHIMTSKRRKRKRQLSQAQVGSPADRKSLQRLLPYT